MEVSKISQTILLPHALEEWSQNEGKNLGIEWNSVWAPIVCVCVCIFCPVKRFCKHSKVIILAGLCIYADTHTLLSKRYHNTQLFSIASPDPKHLLQIVIIKWLPRMAKGKSIIVPSLPPLFLSTPQFICHSSLSFPCCIPLLLEVCLFFQVLKALSLSVFLHLLRLVVKGSSSELLLWHHTRTHTVYCMEL